MFCALQSNQSHKWSVIAAAQERLTQPHQCWLLTQRGAHDYEYIAIVNLVERAAAALPADFDIDILEMHHRQKVDAPSGTALVLGKAAAKGRGVDFDAVKRLSREGQTGARPSGEIGFATLRGGTVPGDHQVVFAGTDARIEIGHRAADRGIFAAGAVQAAAWLAGQEPGLYTMNDVLGLAD